MRWWHTIKKIITALLNSQINETLRKDPDIEVIGNDLLYQEAVLETIQQNEDIDYLLLNDDLPGEKIESFLEKISQIKTIIFTDKSIKNKEIYEKKGVYKIYQNGEIELKELRNIIKETTYTQELEEEIQKLKKQIEIKPKGKIINIPNLLEYVKPKKKYKIEKEIKENQIKLEITIKVK